MKSYIAVLIGLAISSISYAQKYDIKPDQQRINNSKYKGVSSQVNGEYTEVEKYWLSYLKDNGKVRRKRNYFQVSEFNIQDLGVDTLIYVTRVESIDSLGLIWIAPFGKNFEEEALSTLNADLEKILKKATRGYYISEVQEKIDESEAAAVVVSKNHQKLIYEGEKLVADSLATEELKLELETRLEETILKIKVLSQQIIDNDLAIKTTYEDLEQVKNVINQHKESLKKIN